MYYYKIKFEFGSPVGYGYLLIDDQGIQENRITDLSGNTLSLGEYGYFCTDPNELPDWAE
jgi:hypothetical protein